MAEYFSKTLYLRNLKRFWLISAAVFIVAFFTFVSSEIVMRSIRPVQLPNDAASYIFPVLANYCSIFIPILSIITAIAMFGYLYRLRTAGFVSSLPISRLGLYITNWLSGLTIMLAPTLLIGIIYGALLIERLVPIGYFLIWLGILIAAHIFFYSMAVFTAFLTGKALMQAFLFAFLNIVSVGLMGIGYFVAEMTVFGYAGGFPQGLQIPATLLTPIYMTRNMIENIDLSGAPFSLVLIMSWAAYPVYTALFMFFGYRLYRRRRIESAGSIILHKPVQSTFKYLISLFTGSLFGFGFTMIISSGSNFSLYGFVICLIASVIAFGAIGCLFTEMLIHKRIRVWKTAYKSMLFFAAGIAVITLFIYFDGTGYERRVPNPDNVAAVSFSTVRPNVSNSVLFNDYGVSSADLWRSGRGWDMSGSCHCDKCLSDRRDFVWTDEIVDEIKQRTFDYFESPEAIAAAVNLHRAIISGKHHMVDRAIIQSIDIGPRYFLTYKMKNGSTFSRQYIMHDYLLSTLDAADLMLALHGQPEAVNKRNRFASIPDTAVLWARATLYPNFMGVLYPGVRLADGLEYFYMPEDVAPSVLEAMRQDVAAGTLGYLDTFRNNSLYFSRSATLSANPQIIVIEIIYDSDAAGVPSVFMETYRVCADTEERIEGLIQVVFVDANNENTLRAFRELGVFDLDP